MGIFLRSPDPFCDHLQRVPDDMPCGCQVDGTSRIRTDHDHGIHGGRRPPDGRRLTTAYCCGQAGLENRERPTGATAQAVIVEFDGFGVGSEH
jgi:hypothetical protein